jgi:simple sugar transport system ATP-binding protein
MEISDRISVLRLGRHVRTLEVGETNERELALLMVGRQELETVKRQDSRAGRLVLSVRNLKVRDDRDQLVVGGVDFDLREGEILGVAGVDGNGQAELAQALAGLRRPSTGSILMDGRELASCSPAQMIRAGIGYVPEDRQLFGLFPTLSGAENLIADRHSRNPFARNGFLQRRAIDAAAESLIKDFDIRPPNRSLRVGTLSGGNRQKVVVARTFARQPKVLVISQPTRGLDVGATEYIRQRILDERARGSAILLISADLDEIIALSDRVAVMYEGRFMAVTPIEEATVEQIGLLMAGIQPARAVQRDEVAI